MCDRVTARRSNRHHRKGLPENNEGVCRVRDNLRASAYAVFEVADDADRSNSIGILLKIQEKYLPHFQCDGMGMTAAKKKTLRRRRRPSCSLIPSTKQLPSSPLLEYI